MNEPKIWPTVAWGLACFAAFYGYALMVERRHIRERQMQLRRKLYGS